MIKNDLKSMVPIIYCDMLINGNANENKKVITNFINRNNINIII